MMHHFVVTNDNDGTSHVMSYQGKTREDAKERLEAYLFRTAQRGYTVNDEPVDKRNLPWTHR